MAAEALSERLPTPDEKQKASEAISAMARALTNEGGLPLTVKEDDGEVRIELPYAIGELLLELLAHIARGEMVTLVPYGAVLTTQKAASRKIVTSPERMSQAPKAKGNRIFARATLRTSSLVSTR